MSIKDLFNNTGTPKIQKTVSSNELVEQVESKEYLRSKKEEFDQFIPPIDFSSPSNFAKFGSAELYYEKSFERIYQYYPYDGTLAEKADFHNSSSYLDKYVFDSLYPRTNGYVNFDGANHYITVFGGPHTASSGMAGKTLDSTFDNSMLYDAADRRTSAFEYRVDRGATVEFWLKRVASVASDETIFDIWNGEATGSSGYGRIKVELDTSDNLTVTMESGSNGFHDVALITSAVDGNWHHYALTFTSSSSGTTIKSFKNSKYVTTSTQVGIGDILPQSSGINAAIGALYTGSLGGNKFSGSMDEFRYWKTARTPEAIFNTWFIPVGGGTNKYDSNIDLGLYFKFNEGITTNTTLDSIALDYSGRINNGTIVNYSSDFRNTGSAITEKLSEPEYLEPIIYSSHPDVSAKKAEYKTSGSLADQENSSMLLSYLPGWMQEEDEQNGNQLKYLCQVMGSYFDTLWHQISFKKHIHDNHYISGSNKPLPFAKKLLYDRGFVVPDLFVDATIMESLRSKDDNEVYEKQINEVRNIIYHNIYNNLDGIYKSKGTEKSFRNFFRSLGIGQDIVKMRMYADDSTFVLRNNYEYKSYERKYLNFNYEGHFDATLYQTSSATNANIYIPGDRNYSGSLTLETEVILPRKNRSNETGYLPFNSLTASVVGFHSTGSEYTHPGTDYGLSVYAIKESLDTTLNPDDSHRVRFMVKGAFGEITSSVYRYQYENNKWNLAVRVKHANYPYANVTGNLPSDYVLEFYGVEADGNTKRNSFLVTSSIRAEYFTDDKIFYAGAHRTNFTGSSLYDTDIRLGLVRYWHSYLSNAAIDQHAYDSETFGANEPFESDLVNTYPIEIPREKTLALHWAFNDLTSSDSSGELLVSDLSSGSSDSNYGPLSDTIQRYVQGRAVGFNASAQNALDKMYIQTARKRLPDDLMSSDLTTIKTDETEQFFVDEDVSDNFYSFEKSMWGTISDEMLNMFSTALDLNNLIGQPNQKYHHRYNMADFLRDRFYDDVENEPDIEKFTSFYKWIDDSISIAVQQLIPASARFAEKINNVIESHVLERNKYVHQLPTLTTFQSTEASIKGISEMRYDWKHGHAPFFPDEEQTNVLWQRERKEKSGLRETLRKSRSNHSLQSSGLTRKEVGGSTRISDVYAVRKFAKTYDVSMVSQNTIHGGTNFARQKNLQLFHESIQPQGSLGSSGNPQNVITVGAGSGDGLVRGTRNDDNAPRKRKYNSKAKVGNREGQEYGHEIQGGVVLPMNLMSGTVHTGYNKEVQRLYTNDVIISNLHHDSVGNYNDTSIQGPFTEAHIGGLQYRHIDINKYDASKSVDVVRQTGGTFPSGSIQFTASVLATKLTAGTGSSVTIRDGDGTTVTALYSNVFDLYDNQWTNMDDLVFIIENKLNVTANKISDNFLALTQSVTGNFYNYQIQSSSHGYITASGFDGGTAITYTTTQANVDGPANRPEGWGLVFKDHPSVGDNDGAFGFVGADHGTSYPNPLKLKATRYREETAKRPVNIKNIKTVSGSQKAGNYTNEIQIFSTSPEFQKTWAVEAYNNPNVQILPISISQSLPLTTHYQTLMGVTTYSAGNVFGTHANNRQPDGALRAAATPGALASGSFEISGATVVGQTASGSFNVTGSPYAGAFASGSFEITSSMVQGTFANGSFTMSGTYSPAVSASYDFQVKGRTILGEEASGSFEVSGAFIASAPATASFNVLATPVAGNRSYAIMDVNYQLATDTDEFILGRNGNSHGVEIDINNNYTPQNTPVSPVNYQNAAPVSGSNQGFEGDITLTNRENFCLSMWVKIPDTSLNEDQTKFLYQTVDGSGKQHFEIFFNSGSTITDRRKLYINHYVTNGGVNNGNYGQWIYGTFGDTGAGLDNGAWTNIMIFRFGTTETELYKNGSLYTTSATTNHKLGSSPNFNGIDPRRQIIMSGSSTPDHDWHREVYISDWIMWGSSSNFASPTGRQNFVDAVYRSGDYEPYIESGSILVNRFTFGDDGSDPSPTVRAGEEIFSTYRSGSNITSSFDFNYAPSNFANKKTSTEYFDDLKAAILSHNSDGDYFGVNYTTYTQTSVGSISTTWYEESLNEAIVPGNTYTLPGGSTLNFARFFITSSIESDAANYQINASVVTSSTDNQKKSFKNLNYDGTGSLEVSPTATEIEDTTLTIDSNIFRFDHHNNDQSGNKIATFSTTGSAISGSDTANLGYFYNTSYPSTSTLNGGSNLSVSFWHARATADTQIDTILSLDAPTGPTNNEGALFVYSTDTNIFLKAYENSSTSKSFYKSYLSMGINEDDLNHYVFTFNTSVMGVKLYVNGQDVGSVSTLGSAASFSHTFNAIYVAGNPSSTAESLEGRLDQVSVWDKILTATEVSDLYNQARKKDLYGTVCAENLVHWYKLGDEPGLPSLGSNLAAFGGYKDRTIRSNSASSIYSAADLTINNGADFTVVSGLATDTLSNTTFWTNLSSSIEANVAGYDVAYVDNTTYATFTVTNEVVGTAGNGDSLSEDSNLINSLETTTGGGVDQSGTTDGSYIVIDSKKFEADDDGTSDTASIFYIQNTASNTEFWNALSQSIKDNTNFDTITIGGSGDTRIFSITSSIRQASDNNAIDSVNGDFSIVANTAGGVDDTGAVDGHYINLRPTTAGGDARLFTVDRDNDGVDDTPINYRYIYSVQASDADWWDAISSSIEAEGYSVSYVADSPNPGTASFTVTSYVAGAAGNNGSSTLFSGDTFINLISPTTFAGGLDASGSTAGHTITVSGTVFTLIDTGVPTSTQVLVTGSGVTSETMFEDLRNKIETQTGLLVTTASSGIPRLFEISASVTGSGNNPSLSETGDTFTLLNTGVDGVEEVGAEAGDSISIGGRTFTIVSGVPTGTEISFTGSSEAIRNALSQSIKDSTVFDTITVTDLGTGYHKFELTSSVVGAVHNTLFTTNSSGVRDTFQNLVGAAGGEDSSGIEDQDNITIGSITFHLTSSSPGDNSTNKYVETTGSSNQIWTSLENKIESALSYNVARVDSGGIATFSLTGSTTGSYLNTSLSEVGNSFTSLVNIAGGTDESGIQDDNRLRFSVGSGLTFVLTASSPGDTSNVFYVETTGTSQEIWSSLESKIETNTSYNVTTSSAGPTALFSLTASTTGSANNSTFTVNPDPGRSFFSLINIAGGVDYVAPVYGPDNVIMRPRTDLTGSERNINTRFSAPGGPEIQSYGYLDAYTSTYSVHNALPFRNLSVLGSGSGESTTIRVEDHLGKRRGLKTLRTLHMGQFGADSQFGAIESDGYVFQGSFNKQHRNRSRAYEYSSGVLIITGSNYDNMHINSSIPRSEFQYSWIRAAVSGSGWEDTQTRILGYAPRDGMVSSSAGYVEAIVFPTASTIFAV